MENYLIEICMASIVVNVVFCIVTIVMLARHYRRAHGEFLDEMDDIEETAVRSLRSAYQKGVEECMKTITRVNGIKNEE